MRTPAKNNQGMSRIAALGSFLSQSIMPNIGAFIAWGLLTALFTVKGWFPNPHLSQLIGPIMQYGLPAMIAYTGGRRFGGDRGGAIGVLATMGLIVGAQVPMIFGAMLMGPLSGWLLKKIDQLVDQKIPIGFEMLSSNFIAAFLGLGLAVLNFWIVGPLVFAINNMMVLGMTFVIDRGLLFLSAFFIEPSKVLFLNNALNHGVLSPIGMQMAQKYGQSALFLLETNPGPGLGLLLAYMAFGKNEGKRSAAPAAIIHFFGGIHEIYFPYVLMQPLLVLPLIMSGLTGNLYFQMNEVGLVATPSPGSALAILALAPKTSFLHVIVGMVLSAGVSFVLVALVLMKVNRGQLVLETSKTTTFENMDRPQVLGAVYVACDAGMGSSALGAALVTRILAERGLVAPVKNVSLEHIPPDATLVITYNSLVTRAKLRAPGAAFIGISDFLDKQAYEEAITMMSSINSITSLPILQRCNIILNQKTVSKDEAIVAAGKMLVQAGYVDQAYVEGMLAREEKFSTYIGCGVAIPHGENTVKHCVKTSGIVVFQYPQGIDFGQGNLAHLVIGIAGLGNEHIQILSNIAEVIEDEQVLAQLFNTSDLEFVYNAFSEGLST